MRASERRLPGEPSPLALIHLRKGTTVGRVWPTGPGGAPARDVDGGPPPSTDFGVDPRAMELLADLRTDLDSFSEVEAKALMSAGYVVAGHVFRDPGWAGASYVDGEGDP
ncbi:MAG TPA: hypothetical protein VFZ75_07575, partial [Actinomycetota bacterium]|nr:hypothetical protein [Actinomycetota bacterium]